MSAVERGDGWLRIGPVLITTWKQHRAREGNALEIGYVLGRSGQEVEFTDRA